MVVKEKWVLSVTAEEFLSQVRTAERSAHQEKDSR